MKQRRRGEISRLLAVIMCLIMTVSLMPADVFARTVTSKTGNGKNNKLQFNLSSEGILTWTAVESGALSGATGYNVVIRNAGRSLEGNKDVSEASFDLIGHMDNYKKESGTYSVEVHAKGVTNYGDEWIYSYVSPFEKLDAPANPRWDGSTARWDAVANATGYSMQLFSDGGFAQKSYNVTGEETSIDCSGVGALGDGWYFTIVAKADGFRDSNYNESPKKGSASRTITPKLSAGTYNKLQFSLSDTGVLTWSGLEGVSLAGATGYNVVIRNAGGSLEGNKDVTEASFDLFGHMDKYNKEAGYYSVQVQAQGVSNCADVWSFYYMSPYEKLNAPANPRWEGATAKWDAVSNATKYIVTLYSDEGYLRRSFTISAVETSMDCSRENGIGVGWYFRVKAEADGYRESNYNESPKNPKSTVITSASATVVVPKAGDHPDFSPISGNADAYTVEVVAWYDKSNSYNQLTAEDVFVGDNNYSVKVRFIANEGYGFAPVANYIINGAESNMVYETAQERGMDFAVKESVSLTAGLPDKLYVGGRLPRFVGFSVPETAKYSVTDFGWYEAGNYDANPLTAVKLNPGHKVSSPDGELLQAYTTYYAVFVVDSKNGYVFGSESSLGYFINDSSENVSLSRESDDRVIIKKAFTAQNDEKAEYTVMYVDPEDEKNTWIDIVNGVGTTYTLTDHLTAPLGKELDVYSLRCGNSISFEDRKIGLVAGEDDINVYSDIVFVPVWKDRLYTVKVTSDGLGTAAADVTIAKAGTIVTLTATPNSGETFKSWAVVSASGYTLDIKDNTFIMPYGDVEIMACFHDHVYTKTVDDKYLKSPAGCEDKAVYYTSCSVCGGKGEETFEYGEALGHDWNAPTYIWATDNSTVTATRVCKRDANHKETETATATLISNTATADKEGIATYEATFENPAFTKQTKEVKSAAKGNGSTSGGGGGSSSGGGGGGSTGGGGGGGAAVDKPAVSGDVAKPPVTVSDNIVKTPEKGDTVEVKAGTGDKTGAVYTVTDAAKKEVSFSLPEGTNVKTVTIPATVTAEDGTVYTVTEIPAGAFKGVTGLKKIIIGSNITKIDENAFDGCENVKVITVDATNLKTVDKNALNGVNKKAKIVIKAKNKKTYKKIVKKFKKAGAKKATYKFKKIKTKKNKK